ncbi:MAG: hypothetical protein AABX70_06050 [Nanoarchaeota archaeon]
MYFGKKVRILLKGQAKERYLTLKERNDKESQSILNSFYHTKNILLEHPQHGDPIRKELIPVSLKRADICNLYRIELPGYWRMLYTIESDATTLYIFILNLMNHKEYNQLFGYK